MDTSVVAKRFTKNDVLTNCKGKLFDIRNGRELIKTLLMTPYKQLTGFNLIHMPPSYKKETYEKIWQVAKNDLQQTCNSRFRTEFNNSHWCIRNWQICEGNFEVRRNSDFGHFFDVESISDANEIVTFIQKEKSKIICINDNISNDSDFENISEKINNALKNKFNKKSQFEI